MSNRDKINTFDRVRVTYSGPAKARHPCPVCGAETKEHRDGTRICSKRSCRTVSTGSVVLQS